MTMTAIDVLRSRRIVDDQALSHAREEAESSGESLLNVLVRQRAVTRKEAVAATVAAAGLDFIEVLDVTVDPEVASLLTGDQARRYNALPVRLEGNTLLIITDPANASEFQIREDLQAITRHPLRIACSLKEEVAQRINQVYRSDTELGQLVEDVLEDENVVDIEAPVASASDAPLVKYVNILLSQAISDGASDIHVEPHEDYIRVRYRIDGVLKEMQPAPKELQSALISRLKIMSDMDIAERRIPQDGRLSVRTEGKTVDLRVACLPTVWGEKIVMRILDNSAAAMALSQLGFSDYNLSAWRSAYEKPYGMVIVSGPTGSGKSTTLYATLNAIARPEVNIVTVEDPVEYRIPGINQVQMNTKAGLTFASALRSILRGDPDVILIGEIRDGETAKIAIESALTGHLVLTTLHTNDAPGVVTRLTEMGVEPFLVTSALECATGQRLARRLCMHCRKAVQPTVSELAAVGFEYPEGIEATFFEAEGCTRCAFTGFRGRIGLHEVMLMSDEIARLATERASTDAIREAAIAQGMRTLRQDGWSKVAQGMTSINEVLRVVAS